MIFIGAPADAANVFWYGLRRADRSARNRHRENPLSGMRLRKIFWRTVGASLAFRCLILRRFSNPPEDLSYDLPSLFAVERYRFIACIFRLQNKRMVIALQTRDG